MNSVEDLDVFKLAHQLALKAYAATKAYPKEELFSLGDQTRRAAASVGMNLMEGAMRLGSKEYRQFVGIARGSAGEACYQLLLARDLKYISNETYQELRSGYDRVTKCCLDCLNHWATNHVHERDRVSLGSSQNRMSPRTSTFQRDHGSLSPRPFSATRPSITVTFFLPTTSTAPIRSRSRLVPVPNTITALLTLAHRRKIKV